MDERRLELKVGLLVLAALGSGALLFYWLGALDLGGDRVIHVDFAHSGGVPAGAPVKLAGVNIGRVRAVHLLAARRDREGLPLPVRMDLGLRAEILADLRSDATVSVAFQGALGEPFLEVGPGSPGAPPLANGAELRGRDPPRLDQLIGRVDDLVNGAHRMLGTDSHPMAQLITDASGLASNAAALLQENRQALGELIQQASAAAGDLRAAAQQAHALLGDGKVKSMVADAAAVASSLREEVPPLAHDARKLTASAANLGGDFTLEDGAHLRAAIAHYEQAAADLDRIASRAEAVLTEVEAGRGTLGGMYRDPKVYEDLKALVSDLKKHPWKVLWKDE